ncbi:PepSY domain-containing protein [Rhodopseudomonas boonkerdii]|nr:PepSY domain-containing protein [Rhodopseudomonas boonkerdii]
MRKAVLPMLAVGALVTAVPAMAADVYVPRAPRAAVAVPVMPVGPLTVEQAIQVAYRIGVVQVKNTHFDGDEWEIEGRDAYGKWIQVDVDARTGEVRNVDRSII